MFYVYVYLNKKWYCKIHGFFTDVYKKKKKNKDYSSCFSIIHLLKSISSIRLYISL